MIRQHRLRPVVLLALSLALAGALPAQGHDDALSDAEVEQLREAAYTPDQRVLIFVKLIDVRADRIRDLATKPRRPGREEDLHDLFEQCSSILDELNDNLDDYGSRHRDLRKQLPKLLQATDRWATALRTPADNETYNVSRTLALEAVRDTHDEAAKLEEEQHAWFTAHPPAKEQNGPVELPSP